jgi:hypothetical protein
MILDHIEMLDFPDDKVERYGNEFQSLRNLSQGLSLLYESTRRIEQKAKEQIKDGSVLESMPPEVRKSFEGKDIRYFSVGNDPSLAWLNKGLLYSFFQWYSVSACNYVRLIGWLSLQENIQMQSPLQYVNLVIPNVLWFRNKIAAHFARASNNGRDTEADRVASVLYQVGFDNGRFYASIWKVSIRRKSEKSTSSNEAAWSITETHEGLIKRFKPKTEEKQNG